MKKLFTLLLIFITCISFAQQKLYKKYKKDESTQEYTTATLLDDGTSSDETLEESEQKYGVINENISFGLSLGFNGNLETIQTAQISPIDNTLVLSDIQSTNFVLSTVISIPFAYKESKIYRFADKDGEPTGQIHKISNWSFIASVNLATLQGAQSGNIFNQKISGGLGISYNFSEDFSIGLTYELISNRTPKDFLIDLDGQEILENGQTLTTLDITDNNYFFDKYISTLSFKFIYKLTK